MTKQECVRTCTPNVGPMVHSVCVLVKSMLRRGCASKMLRVVEIEGVVGGGEKRCKCCAFFACDWKRHVGVVEVHDDARWWRM